MEETPKKCKDIIKTARSLLNDVQFAQFGDDPKVQLAQKCSCSAGNGLVTAYHNSLSFILLFFLFFFFLIGGGDGAGKNSASDY